MKLHPLYLPVLLGIGLIGVAGAACNVDGTNGTETNVMVGEIQVSSAGGGANYFTKADNTVFCGCDLLPTKMWAGGSAAQDIQGTKGILAALLTAKAISHPVTVLYSFSDHYCRYTHVVVQ